MQAFERAAPDLAPRFVRAVVVGGAGGGEARDLLTSARVDARLFCDGDRFVRFEASVQLPADARLRDGYYSIQEAASVAAFRWSRARAAQTIHAMTAEVAEYLRASQERGDVFVSGKTERHAGRDGDIGVFWSLGERSFVIVGAN
ncbi:MAG TPA: hypothetical protein VIL72_06485 [Beijerinckiaceae bacterium]